MTFFVYILASKRNGTLYIGMTDDLGRRMVEHREGLFAGFTKKYGVATLFGLRSSAAVPTHLRANAR